MRTVGDTFTRMLGGTVAMPMRVTDVIDNENVYGQLRPVIKAVAAELKDEFPDRWMFDLITGAEIDYDLGWGPKGTGSIAKEIAEKPLAERLIDAYSVELLESFQQDEFEMFWRQLGASEQTIGQITEIWTSRIHRD